MFEIGMEIGIGLVSGSGKVRGMQIIVDKVLPGTLFGHRPSTEDRVQLEMDHKTISSIAITTKGKYKVLNNRAILINF